MLVVSSQHSAEQSNVTATDGPIRSRPLPECLPENFSSNLIGSLLAAGPRAQFTTNVTLREIDERPSSTSWLDDLNQALVSY